MNSYSLCKFSEQKYEEVEQTLSKTGLSRGESCTRQETKRKRKQEREREKRDIESGRKGRKGKESGNVDEAS